jgi:hypothetical protein
MLSRKRCAAMTPRRCVERLLGDSRGTVPTSLGCARWYGEVIGPRNSTASSGPSQARVPLTVHGTNN